MTGEGATVSDNYEDQYDWDAPLTSGLLESYVGIVRRAEFGVDDEYNEGNTLQLVWEVEFQSTDDDTSDLELGHELTEKFNVGNVDTWEASPDGKSVARVDGKKVRFNENSGIGQLIGRALPSSKKAMDGADKLAAILRERGGGHQAKIWEGLTFLITRQEFGFKDRESGEKVTYHRNYPAAFLGVAGDAGTATAPAATATATATATAGPSRADLLALAATHDSYGAFLAAAMSTYPGVEDGEHAAGLLDEAGIYAEAHQ
jgi:hypothetical protein